MSNYRYIIQPAEKQLLINLILIVKLRGCLGTLGDSSYVAELVQGLEG